VGISRSISWNGVLGCGTIIARIVGIFVSSEKVAPYSKAFAPWRLASSHFPEIRA
jgi:hypothetical protein